MFNILLFITLGGMLMDMQYVQGKPLFTYINIYGNKCDYIKRDKLLYTAKKMK